MDRHLAGIAAAPGVAIGPAWVFRPGAGTAAAEPLPDIEAAAERAAADLDAIAERMRADGRAEDAGILEAQALMAQDPMLIDGALARAAGETDPARLAEAVEAAAEEAAATLAAIPDELLAARAADVRDVGARISRIITGRVVVPPAAPSVAVAEDLPPSVTAELPPGSLLGIALAGGTPTSHAAILARGLSIPCVVAVSGLLETLGELAGPEGRTVTLGVDGGAGVVVLEPDAEDRGRLRSAADARAAAGDEARRLRGRPGTTADGHHVPLVANIGRPEDAERALEHGAEGVGLFRTEFIFGGRTKAPGEDEQAAAYARVMTAFGPDRPVVIRLADIGGDKPLPYLDLPPEQNPFLGVRALRLAYEDRSLLLTQLRAIARAGAMTGVTPHLMAPMVATVDDVRLLRSLVDEATATLDAAAVPRSAELAVGIMIEVPSAALIAHHLAPLVDFFSIGSNDLTQYVLAADRSNPRLAALGDALHPAVLRAIASTVAGADGAGIPVAVCGELASDPAGALVLVGLGVDELSMDAAALDEVRLVLSRVGLEELVGLAAEALDAPDAAWVREAAGRLLARGASEG